MKIFDCFKFFNEYEILDLRLMTLDPFVDKFVICESSRTHTGNPKPFYFEENKHLYEQYLSKIVIISVNDLPIYEQSNLWTPENFQRNCISRGLEGVAQPGDKIFVSDCDEIWNPEVAMEQLGRSDWVAFEQKLFYYFVNCQQNVLWNGTCMATYGTFNQVQDLREFARFHCPNPVKNGGWHYSYAGDASKLKEKIDNIAESSLVYEKLQGKFDLEEIQKKIDSGEDFMDRPEEWAKKQFVPLKGNSPDCIYEFLLKYPHLYKEI